MENPYVFERTSGASKVMIPTHPQTTNLLTKCKNNLIIWPNLLKIPAMGWGNKIYTDVLVTAIASLSSWPCQSQYHHSIQSYQHDAETAIPELSHHPDTSNSSNSSNSQGSKDQTLRGHLEVSDCSSPTPTDAFISGGFYDNIHRDSINGCGSVRCVGHLYCGTRNSGKTCNLSPSSEGTWTLKDTYVICKGRHALIVFNWRPSRFSDLFLLLPPTLTCMRSAQPHLEPHRMRGQRWSKPQTPPFCDIIRLLDLWRR